MSGDIPPTRRGYVAKEAVSALQKAVRRSSVDDALYWSLELVLSGFGHWFWKRVRIIAVEDVSPEAVGLVADLRALHENWLHDTKNGSDGNLYVARAAISLAIAPKSRITNWGLIHHASSRNERRDVPDHALDMHTPAGRKMGRGRQHFLDEASRLEPWTGSLDALEADYRAKAAVSSMRPSTSTLNPTDDVEPAQNPHSHGSGQLRIDADR